MTRRVRFTPFLTAGCFVLGVAAVQNPNRLRATILTTGPQASVVEETPTDLPLALACPLDVPSGVVVATLPVELIGFDVE